MAMVKVYGVVLSLIVCGLSLPHTLVAQNEDDALRFSLIAPGGTARSNGLANAFGALGADPSAAGINPAGLGLYRTTELSLTPAFEVNEVKSTHYGASASDSQSRLFFNNLALVLNNPSERDGKWRSGTYGVVYDRQVTYHYRGTVNGGNVPSTVLQSFVNEAAGTSQNRLGDEFPFTAGLAWDTYGIDPIDSASSFYQSAIPFGSPTTQIETVATSGAGSNTSFFYAGNYMDRLYLGASLGIAGIRYSSTTVFTETSQDHLVDLQEVKYTEEFTTSGSGFDLKLGLIVRPTDRLRLGAAYHSPQWLRLNDAFLMTMNTRFRTPDLNGRTSYAAVSPDGFSAYQVNSPWRLTFSAAYVAGPNGLFSIDYEYADFRKMQMRSSDPLLYGYDFERENRAIEQSFRAVHTVRAGTEWRQGNWYYRLGWAISPDAYLVTDPRHGQAQLTYAGGFGYRSDHISVDLGMNYQRKTTERYLYDRDLIQATTARYSTIRTMLTIGFRA